MLTATSLTTATSAASTAKTGPCEALVEIKDWTFWLGPGFVIGIGNGLLLGYLM